MSRAVKAFVGLVMIFLIMAFPLLVGCEGSDSRKKVDNTVKELAGKKQVDQMKKMKKDIGDISKQQMKRLDDLKKSVEE